VRLVIHGVRFRAALVASIVALGATALTAATAGATAASDQRVTEATATAPAHTPRVAEPVRRLRPDPGAGLVLGLLAAGLRGPAVSSGAGQDRAYGVVLLDGSDRWRSLLLGAPPLLV
jgi:hypothetical protein